MPDNHCREILRLLTIEREAIVSANFDKVMGLGDSKAALFEGLETIPATKEMIQEIKTSLQENQTLLSAAIAGVRAASVRLSALQSVREGLSVYDQSGTVSNVISTRPGVERKA